VWVAPPNYLACGNTQKLEALTEPKEWWLSARWSGTGPSKKTKQEIKNTNLVWIHEILSHIALSGSNTQSKKACIPPSSPPPCKHIPFVSQTQNTQ
jgi:hypothetical protein